MMKFAVFVIRCSLLDIRYSKDIPLTPFKGGIRHIFIRGGELEEVMGLFHENWVHHPFSPRRKFSSMYSQVRRVNAMMEIVLVLSVAKGKTLASQM